MDAERIRTVCLRLPHVTESVQWGDDLVFKVGGKMFAVAPLEPGAVLLSFKCSEEDFADLVERPGIIPAPYLARARWVAIEDPGAMSAAEIKASLEKAYRLVWEKLPKKTREGLPGRR